jgi:hypothetical protein
MDVETRDFITSFLDGYSKAEQVDRLEDLSAELLVRADDLRAEMAAAEEES